MYSIEIIIGKESTRKSEKKQFRFCLMISKSHLLLFEKNKQQQQPNYLFTPVTPRERG